MKKDEDIKELRKRPETAGGTPYRHTLPDIVEYPNCLLAFPIGSDCIAVYYSVLTAPTTELKITLIHFPKKSDERMTLAVILHTYNKENLIYVCLVYFEKMVFWQQFNWLQ